MTARLLEAVPDLLRPSWMRATWGGEFGTGRLVASIRNATSEVVIAGDRLTGDGAAGGLVTRMDAARDTVEYQGYFSRKTALYATGTRRVHHEILQLEPEVQGSRFATRFNEHAMERYRSAGVNVATVDAAEVGSYTWARGGFELIARGTPEEQLAKRALQVRSLVDRARLLRKLSDAEFAALLPRLATPGQQLPPDVLASVRELAALRIGEETIGKRVLVDQSWSGFLPITPGRTEPARTAATAVMEQLPRQFAHGEVAQAFDQQGLLLARPSSTTTLAFGAHDEVTSLTGSHSLVLPDASRVPIEITIGRDGALVGVEHRSGIEANLRRRLDAGWRALGVDSVRHG